MKDKIIETLFKAWEFIKATIALIFIAFIFSLVCFLTISALYLSLWSFDYLFLGGAIFG